MLVVAAFEARSETETVFTVDTFNSSRMNLIAVAEIAGAFLITQADFLRRLLGTAQLTARQWGLALAGRRGAAHSAGKPASGSPAERTPAEPRRHRPPDSVSIQIIAPNGGRRDGQEAKATSRAGTATEVPTSTDGAWPDGEAGPPPKMKRKEYEQEMRLLHGELVAVQEWVKASGAKICIVFEGRDTAGKGGTIKRITERVSPRVFRVVALSAPTEREKSQMYIQRYVPHLPAAGEVVIFDRSWYNRAGVERVMGFCTPEETERFLEQVPAVEKAMVDSGILLLKYWLEVSADEQTRRLESRINDPRKIWKLSDMDLKSYSRWYDYSRARDAMFAATDTAWAPWYIAHTDDKKRGRLNIISHLLSQIPYQPLAPRDVTLPNAKGPGATSSRICRCGTSRRRSRRRSESVGRPGRFSPEGPRELTFTPLGGGSPGPLAPRRS